MTFPPATSGVSGPPTQPAAPLDAVAVLENMGDAFYALDGQWRFTYANRRALDFWGNVRFETLIGGVIWDVFPAMRETYNETALREVAATRRALMFEGPSPTTGAFVSVTISPIGQEGVAVYFRDITERKQAEQRLRAGEEHLRLAQEAGGIGAWERSLTADEMLGSEQMFRLLGREPESSANLLPILRAALHPEEREAVMEAAAAFRRRPGPMRLAARILWPSGEVRWLVFIGRVMAGPDGAPERMLGVCIDVTDRRRNEEALRASAERVRLALKAGSLGTWEYDAETGLREWSRDVAVMFGLAPERTVMSRHEWASVLHPDDAARMESTFDAALASGDDYACEYRIPQHDGSVRWAAAYGSVLRDADGASTRVIGIIQDITQRHRDQERLRELNRGLEARVAAEVAARQAAQARAAHAERMQALGQLAGGVAHDFNNVLQAVQGGASLIERRPDDPASVRRFARMVLDAASRGSAIAGRLLAFARRGDLRAETVDPVELLNGLREILAYALGASVAVRVDLAADLPPLRADRGQLETALVNLATNARDAMPGGGELALSAAAETVGDPLTHPAGLPAGSYVRLTAADTGPGMDAATLARASEPFFTTKPIGKGTGLGLAMARGFAEQSGGGFAIESRIGRGTTVHLWFPVATGPTVPAEPQDTGLRHESAARVLLVDDDRLVRGALAAELARAGYTVVEAGAGAEARRLIEAGAPVDALVTDLSVPGGDGLALVRTAQALRPGLPAVLLTSYAGEGASAAVSGTLSGPFTLLRKPVARDQLADCLAALLAGRGTAEAEPERTMRVLPDRISPG